MSEVILVGRTGGIATVTFNRPHALNAIDQTTLDVIQETFSRLEADPEVRVVVLKGAGDNFMAGGDVKFFAKVLDLPPAERRRQMEAVVLRIHPVMVAIARMPAPVIACVRGAAAGFGMSLVAACDLAVAAEDAYFNLAYCRIGVCPEGGGSFHLPRIVGLKKAMEIALLSDKLDAQTALALGLVNRVVPVAELDATVQAMAERLAAGATRAFGNTKRLLRHSLHSTLEEQLQAEAESFGDCAASEDFVEGVRAFVEKRRPRFAGK